MIMINIILEICTINIIIKIKFILLIKIMFIKIDNVNKIIDTIIRLVRLIR